MWTQGAVAKDRVPGTGGVSAHLGRLTRSDVSHCEAPPSIHRDEVGASPPIENTLRARPRNTRAAPAVVEPMSTITPPLASFRSTARGSSLLIFTLCFAACEGQSPMGPEGGVVMGRVYAGHGFTCGIVEGGKALCWGINDEGQLGEGGFYASYKTAPRVISDDLSFRQLGTKASGRHVCGVTTSGDAYCWGENDFGQLGHGSASPRDVLRLVAGGLTFTSITAGWRSSCGVTTDEEAYCWGRGEWGQLGDGLATLSSVPVAVAGGHKFQKLEVGSSNLVCGLTTAGKILCWGLDLRGALGAPGTAICVRTDGLELACATTPQPIASDELFMEVSAGSSFACGITLSCQALCWGRNDWGQLGRPTTETCAQGIFSGRACGRTPMPVLGPQRFVMVTAGLRHACGVTVDGDAYCWGRDSLGELGRGSDTLAASRWTVMRTAGAATPSASSVGDWRVATAASRRSWAAG